MYVKMSLEGSTCSSNKIKSLLTSLVKLRSALRPTSPFLPLLIKNLTMPRHSLESRVGSQY